MPFLASSVARVDLWKGFTTIDAVLLCLYCTYTSLMAIFPGELGFAGCRLDCQGRSVEKVCVHALPDASHRGHSLVLIES